MTPETLDTKRRVPHIVSSHRAKHIQVVNLLIISENNTSDGRAIALFETVRHSVQIYLTDDAVRTIIPILGCDGIFSPVAKTVYQVENIRSDSILYIISHLYTLGR
jgi:2-polyprenyl-6-methoxyphenol hydroxylase-like FAD-dependent oxidoreductase